MTPNGEDTAGDSVTGRVEVAGYMLEIGAPTGVQITGAAQGPPAAAEAIKIALADDEDAWTKTLSERVDEASDATGKAERAVVLFRAVAEGRLDAASVKAEVDALLDLLDRLDKDERWQEALDLARALSGLLGLLMRWAQLVGSLRLALRAAGSLDDLAGVAWARHELGSLELVAGNTAAAERGLGEARDLRQQLGDRRGLAATERNLQVLCHDLRQQLREGRLAPTDGGGFFRRSRVVVAVVALTLLLAGGVAGAVVDGGGGDGPDVAPPVRELSVTIRAPVEGQRVQPGARVVADFSCAAEDAANPSCEGTVGGREIGDGERVPTSPGRHTLTVTATTDDGRRATESVTYTVSDEARGDTQDPRIRIVSPGGGTIPAKPRPVADFTCLDEPGGSGIVRCDATIDGRRVADGDRLPARGTHVFRVVAVDGAGRTAEQTVTYSIGGQPTQECSDRVDNDDDGLFDAGDPGCKRGTREAEDSPKCADGTEPPCEDVTEDQVPDTTPAPPPVDLR